MKPLNEVKNWEEQNNEELRQVALDMMIEAQIKGLERLMETNGSRVKSPLAYNLCVGLIEQLKYYAPAAFKTGEVMFNNEFEAGLAGKPLFGKP